MRPLYLLAASALALTATACAPKTPVARAALDCPMRQGDLSRTSASADGKVCTYTGANGAEVTLQLVSTQGGVDQALSTIETNLLVGRDTRAKGEKVQSEADGKAAENGAKHGFSLNGEFHNDDVAKAAKQAAEDAKGSGVKVETKDGKTVITTEGEDKDGNVRVSLPGIHVVANEKNDSAQVTVGPIHIDAGGDGATVHMRRDVRLRGEALNPERRGVRATFIYTGADLPAGYRFVGYEAGGPTRGPITVAIVKSRSEGPDGGDLYPDVKKLVRKNGGV